VRLLVRTPSLVVGVICTVLLLSISAAAAAQCDQFEELLTTTPAPPQNAWLWKFYAERLAATPPGNYNLVLLGDSLAQRWPVLSLSPLNVANLGVGGDQTQHVLWRLSSPELAKLKPSKILIVIGTNNLTVDISPCAIIAGIGKIIERASEVWPSAEMAFLEIAPRGDSFMFKNDQRMEVNKAIRQIARAKSVNVDDAITCEWHSPCVNYEDDKIHFSEVGYQLLGRIIKSTMFQN